jgi:three-Cys-motif partner protein
MKPLKQQTMFGGHWTQRKLEVLSEYLRAYTKIFKKNARARFFETTYVDAFAGTGVIPRPEPGPFIASFFPERAEAEEEFRKGSVKRALEVEPPFDHYVFIEKDAAKCEELKEVSKEFPKRDIRILNADANSALLDWCERMDTERERAVVFLDPFGASVEWRVIEALADTRAVDLWVLFPYAAINRMLVSSRTPPKAWAKRLTTVFGTAEWEEEFYETNSWHSLMEPGAKVDIISKVADLEKITDFFVKRLRATFAAVAKPGFLRNSKGVLFVLLFAAGNARGARPGIKIANHLLERMNQ